MQPLSQKERGTVVMQPMTSVSYRGVIDEELKARLTQLRAAHKMTVEQMVVLSGVPAPYYLEIEQGKIDPPLSILRRIARAFMVEPGLLLTPAKICTNCWNDAHVGPHNRCCGEQQAIKAASNKNAP